MKTPKNQSKRTAKKQMPVNISHHDKVFWPEDGYTKGDLAEFYVSIFPKLEPYVMDRLLTLERCPDGMVGQCFYQKEMPKGMPANTPTKRIKNEESERPFTNYVVGGSLETQLALVNLGCIAIHAMGGRAASPRQPDWVCFDLDPDCVLAHGVLARAYTAQQDFTTVMPVIIGLPWPLTAEAAADSAVALRELIVPQAIGA